MSAEEVLFAFEDPERRTFVAISRDRSYYHLVHPAQANDIRVSGWARDGEQIIEPKVNAGDLVCECASGRIRGTCYVVEAAKRELTVDFTRPAEAALVGAGEAVEAYRG